MLRHLGVARSDELGELARIERDDHRRIGKDCTAAVRQGTQNTVRVLQRLLYRSVVIEIRITSGAMANDDENIAVLAGFPCSRLDDRQRVQEHMKREDESRRGGDPSPQAYSISATSEHRIDLAEPPLALWERKLKTKCRSSLLDCVQHVTYGQQNGSRARTCRA
jgi:hypothetical protein